MKYRKKPVVIEAIQWNGSLNRFRELQVFSDKITDGGAVWYPNAIGTDDDCKTSSWPLFIKTLEGTMSAQIGDYIIKGVNGEFYPCKPYIFEKTYDSIEGEDSGPVSSGLPCTFKENPPRVEPL